MAAATTAVNGVLGRATQWENEEQTSDRVMSQKSRDFRWVEWARQINRQAEQEEETIKGQSAATRARRCLRREGGLVERMKGVKIHETTRQGHRQARTHLAPGQGQASGLGQGSGSVFRFGSGSGSAASAGQPPCHVMFMRVVPALCLVLPSGFSVPWACSQLLAYRPAGPGWLPDKGKDEVRQKVGEPWKSLGEGGQERASC